MPVRRVSRSQAILVLMVMAATLCSAYVLALGPDAVVHAQAAPVAGSAPARYFAGVAVARVIDSHGSVTIVRPPQGDEQYTRYLSPVADGLALFPGDQIWTGSGSWVEIDFGDEVRVRIEARSRVEIVSGVLPPPGPPSDGLPSIRLFLGDVWASVVSLFSRFTDFSIETPTAIAGVRGTLFRVSVDVLGKTSVSVHEGVVAVSASRERAAEVLVASGEYTHVIAGWGPETPAPNPPELELEWMRRSEWVLAHFERKEAYELRWQLAAGGADSAISPGTSFEPPVQTVADTGARSSVTPAVSASSDSPATTEPARDPDRERTSQPSSSVATIGLASVGASVEPRKDDLVEDSEEKGDKVDDDGAGGTNGGGADSAGGDAEGTGGAGREPGGGGNGSDDGAGNDDEAGDDDGGAEERREGEGSVRGRQR